VMGTRRINLQLFKRMHGVKLLISGDHDDCWPGHSTSWAKLAMYQEVFTYIQPFLKLTIDGQMVMVSHFPYLAGHTDPPRYNQFRLRNTGSWLLHGHTHSAERLTHRREIHIGADAWDLTPVAEHRIIQMMRNQLQREATGSVEQELPAADDGGAVPAAAVVPASAGQGAEARGTLGNSGGAEAGGPA
jgi:calcineurin-like phosphoesterase family protein